MVAGSPLSAAETNRQFHLPSLYHVGYWVRDIAKSRAFYKDYLGYDEPYVLNRTNGVLQMVVMKVNERQVILLFPDATRILPNGDNLDHLGLETDNIAAAREYGPWATTCLASWATAPLITATTPPTALNR